jgi:glycosyltransferase involved in cell wall biosynthesis
MAAANAGIFFIRPVFSKTASSPTKMGEMLALGLPIVANAGVGDVAEILVETGGGVAITHFDRQSYKRALAELEAFSFAPELRRNAAMERFDVKLGVEHYDNIYRTLA